jgi:hypothetical protein
MRQCGKVTAPSGEVSLGSRDITRVPSSPIQRPGRLGLSRALVKAGGIGAGTGAEIHAVVRFQCYYTSRLTSRSSSLAAHSLSFTQSESPSSSSARSHSSTSSCPIQFFTSRIAVLFPSIFGFFVIISPVYGRRAVSRGLCLASQRCISLLALRRVTWARHGRDCEGKKNSVSAHVQRMTNESWHTDLFNTHTHIAHSIIAHHSQVGTRV